MENGDKTFRLIPLYEEAEPQKEVWEEQNEEQNS